jgi:integrase
MHNLRHTYASLMIAARVDSVFLSRQMGHASPAITWSTYVHLFDRASHADVARAALEAAIGNILASRRGEEDGDHTAELDLG